MFVNPALADFRLTAGSPFRQKAPNIGYTTDGDGILCLEVGRTSFRGFKRRNAMPTDPVSSCSGMRADYFGAWVGLAAHVALWGNGNRDTYAGVHRQNKTEGFACCLIPNSDGQVGKWLKDLKPENVMLLPDAATATGERAKVLDFGIAKLIEANNQASVQTRATELLGTPNYMSPEQCRGPGRRRKTDVYALGVMMFRNAGREASVRRDGARRADGEAHVRTRAESGRLQSASAGSAGQLGRCAARQRQGKAAQHGGARGSAERMTAELPPPAKHRHRNLGGDGGGAKWTARSIPMPRRFAGTTPTTPGTTGVVDKQRRSVVWIGLGISAVTDRCRGGVFGLWRRAKSRIQSPRHRRWPSAFAGICGPFRLRLKWFASRMVWCSAKRLSIKRLSSRVSRSGCGSKRQVLPQDVQISLSASGEVQVVLRPEPPKPPVEAPPVVGKSPTTDQNREQKRVEVPHIEN